MSAKKVLAESVEYTVQFHEVDLMGVVWHGHYLRFFELAREAFTRRYGIRVEEYREAGVMAPVVKVDVKYRAPARYAETLVIEASHAIERQPKLVMQYAVREKASGRLLATGRTVQLFSDAAGTVLFFPPPLLERFWKTWEAR